MKASVRFEYVYIWCAVQGEWINMRGAGGESC